MRSIGGIFVGLFSGITEIVANRDSDNNGSAKYLPQVLPHMTRYRHALEVKELIYVHHVCLMYYGWSTESL